MKTKQKGNTSKGVGFSYNKKKIKYIKERFQKVGK